MKKMILGIIPFIVVVIIWAVSWYMLVANTSLLNWNERGTFGDMFGAVNALFAGLAFAGVIIALYMQKDELRLQRQELEETRQELKGQKEQLMLQNEAFRQQNFENTFFQLMRLHNEIISSLEIIDKPHVYQARDAFKYFYQQFKKAYRRNLEKSGDDNLLELINISYIAFRHEHQAIMGHYFRLLYNIIKFVNNSDITNKKLYTNLVRAQLSTNELLLLFYNCLSDVGKEKFKPLVEQFNLLNNMPKKQLIAEEHIKFYNSIEFEYEQD